MHKEGQIKQLEDEVYRLRMRVKDLEHQLYGAKSEKRKKTDHPDQQTFASIDQSEQWNESDQQVPQKPTNDKPKNAPRKKTKKKGPKSFPKNLERVHISVEDPDLNDLLCPVTNMPMRKGFTQQIEVLSRIPAKYYVKVYTRNIFVSPHGTTPAYSPWPSTVLPKNRIDVSIISHLITARFADHLPYYRISEQLKRLGVTLSDNTMGSLIRQAYEKTRLLYEAIKNEVLKSGYVQLDPTPIDLIDPQRPGRTREGCMWTYRALDGPVFYDFAKSKKGERVDEVLKKYTGLLQTDGANNFGQKAKGSSIIRLGCWVHARRYFHKAENAHFRQASVYLNAIGKLHRIERLSRHFCLSDEKVKALRNRHSNPIVKQIFEMAHQYTRDNLMDRADPMTKAVSYLLRQQKPLRECFKHVPSRIENNPVENAIRPLKLGAKNWLFIGSPQAGPRAAAMFTLIENCRIAQINPEEYLADMLSRIDEHLASKVNELIPQNWKVLSKNNDQQQQPD